ncbi:MAG: hypothetical protein RLZZ609_1488 [Cyanobacteriota bacterium]|jgi:hypothetical protein
MNCCRSTFSLFSSRSRSRGDQGGLRCAAAAGTAASPAMHSPFCNEMEVGTGGARLRRFRHQLGHELGLPGNGPGMVELPPAPRRRLGSGGQAREELGQLLAKGQQRTGELLGKHHNFGVVTGAAMWNGQHWGEPDPIWPEPVSHSYCLGNIMSRGPPSYPHAGHCRGYARMLHGRCVSFCHWHRCAPRCPRRPHPSNRECGCGRG